MIENLLNQLRRLGMSDAAIARALNIDRSTVYRWRNGQNPHLPQQVQAQLIALAFEVRLVKGKNS